MLHCPMIRRVSVRNGLHPATAARLVILLDTARRTPDRLCVADGLGAIAARLSWQEWGGCWLYPVVVGQVGPCRAARPHGPGLS